MSPVVVGAGPNESFADTGPSDTQFLSGIVPFGVLPQIERCWYQDPLGNTTEFTTDLDKRYKEGIEGRFMAPVQHLSDSVPEAHGARYRSTRALPRAVSVPMFYIGDDATTSARAVLRELSAGVNPCKRLNGLPALGKLFVLTEDGLYRYANCLYEQGLDSNTEPTTSQSTYLFTTVRSILLVFRAFDPFWYDALPMTVDVEQTQSTATFFPAPPFRIGPSTVYAAWTQNNPGDVEAWPVWTISGPGEGLSLINDTTGDTLTLDLTIAADQTVIVDTRPGVKTVILGPAGTNLFPYLEGDLWSFDDGDNDLRVEMINTTNDSAVTLEFQPRYQSV